MQILSLTMQRTLAIFKHFEGWEHATTAANYIIVTDALVSVHNL